MTRLLLATWHFITHRWTRYVAAWLLALGLAGSGRGPARRPGRGARRAGPGATFPPPAGGAGSAGGDRRARRRSAAFLDAGTDRGGENKPRGRAALPADARPDLRPTGVRR